MTWLVVCSVDTEPLISRWTVEREHGPHYNPCSTSRVGLVFTGLNLRKEIREKCSYAPTDVEWEGDDKASLHELWIG